MDVDEHPGARDCVPQQFSPVSDHHSTQRPSRGDPTLPNLVSIVHCCCVLDLRPFQNVRLRGGFTLAEVVLTARALLDPLERAATAQTIIRGSRFYVFLRADLDEREISISLYHEVLEAATVAAAHPPNAVLELNEEDFEQAAQAAHARYGLASPETLNQFLAEFGFVP